MSKLVLHAFSLSLNAAPFSPPPPPPGQLVSSLVTRQLTLEERDALLVDPSAWQPVAVEEQQLVAVPDIVAVGWARGHEHAWVCRAACRTILPYGPSGNRLLGLCCLEFRVDVNYTTAVKVTKECRSLRAPWDAENSVHVFRVHL